MQRVEGAGLRRRQDARVLEDAAIDLHQRHVTQSLAYHAQPGERLTRGRPERLSPQQHARHYDWPAPQMAAQSWRLRLGPAELDKGGRVKVREPIAHRHEARPEYPNPAVHPTPKAAEASEEPTRLPRLE